MFLFLNDELSNKSSMIYVQIVASFVLSPSIGMYVCLKSNMYGSFQIFSILAESPRTLIISPHWRVFSMGKGARRVVLF